MEILRRADIMGTHGRLNPSQIKWGLQNLNKNKSCPRSGKTSLLWLGAAIYLNKRAIYFCIVLNSQPLDLFPVVHFFCGVGHMVLMIYGRRLQISFNVWWWLRS